MKGSPAHGQGMRRPLRTVLTLLASIALAGAPVRAWAAPVIPSGIRPVPGAVLTRFDPPDVPWGPGHLGVDLAGRAGETVVASAAGVVTFADVLAGRGVVVVDHGAVRTTYEPVAASVTVGAVLARGDRIGELQAGHPSCAGSTCLHWGLREGDAYLDPQLLLGGAVRLLPASAAPGLVDVSAPESVTPSEPVEPSARRPMPQAAAVPQPLAGAGGALLMPASGPVTSPYGMRRHPLTGVWKLHDGTDIGAPCGAPIRAAATGTVVALGYSGAYGNTLVIDHGGGAAGELRTGYAHAQGFGVAVGAHVSAGEVIGRVGSTGLATGCHLHVQVWARGRLVDPMTVIS